MMNLNRLQNRSDEELIKAYKEARDQHIFEVLYLRYQKKVRQQIRIYIKDIELSEDLLQDVFIKLQDKLPLYEGKSTFPTWLYSFVRNFVFDYMRKHTKLYPINLYEGVEPNVEADEDEDLRLVHLGVILDQLPAIEKELLILKYAYQWRLEDIASQFDLSLSAVKMRLKRAKLRARNLFYEKYNQEK